MKNKEKILALTATLLALILAEISSAEAGAAEPADTSTPDETPEPEVKETKKGGKPPKSEEETGPTLAELRERAQGLMTDGKAEEVKKILKKNGSESLTKLDAKKYAAVKTAFDALAVE